MQCIDIECIRTRTNLLLAVELALHNCIVRMCDCIGLSVMLKRSFRILCILQQSQHFCSFSCATPILFWFLLTFNVLLVQRNSLISGHCGHVNMCFSCDVSTHLRKSLICIHVMCIFVESFCLFVKMHWNYNIVLFFFLLRYAKVMTICTGDEQYTTMAYPLG